MSNKKGSLDQTVTFSSDVQCNWLYTFRTVSGATTQDQVIAATEYLNSDHEQTSSPETESRCPCGSSQFHSRRWGMGSRLPKRENAGNGYLVLLRNGSVSWSGDGGRFPKETC